MAVRIQIKVRSVLSQVPRAMNTEAGRLVQEGLRIGEAVAKVNAPVRTGFLRSSIGVKMTSTMAGTLYARANYAGFVNYGTRRMPARPFMDRGADATKQHILSNARRVGARLPSV